MNRFYYISYKKDNTELVQRKSIKEMELEHLLFTKHVTRGRNTQLTHNHKETMKRIPKATGKKKPQINQKTKQKIVNNDDKTKEKIL